MAVLRVLFFVSVTWLVTEAALLGSHECTFGPSYWCNSLGNAKQCSAVSHCIQSVWEKQVLPEDNDEVCTICKDMVLQARQELEDKKNQDSVIQILDNSCKLIPLQEVKDECVAMVENFVPELFETLASQMNPQVVCATAGLCNSPRVDKLLRESGLPHTETNTPAVVDNCVDCRKFVNDVTQSVQTHSKQELMDHLLTICGELGSLSDGCSALVTVNIDTIYDFLANNAESDEICSLFGMCSDFARSVGFPNINKGDEVCDFCVLMAEHWKKQLVANTTEEEFVEVLDMFCLRTGRFQQECMSFVDSYAKSLYQFLMDNFNPKAACEAVGACSANFHNKPLWSVLDSRVPIVLPNFAQNNPDEEFHPQQLPISVGSMTGDDEVIGNKNRHGVEVVVAGRTGFIANEGKKDEVCTMCEFTLHFIQIQLQDQHTRNEIEAAVKNVCQYLPKDLTEQCQDYVDAYGDQVIALMQQEIDPSILCPMLGLCPNKSPSPEPARKEVVTCVACEFIMKKLKDILNDNTDQQAVKDALDRVCSVLPDSLGSQCQDFVDNNAVEVMQLLAAGVDPEQVCRMLGLCHDHLAKPVEVPRIESTGQPKACVVCEVVLMTVEKFILDNSTESSIQNAMDSVCLHLPTTLQEDCLGFVDQYGKAIIELLINEASPQTICREIRLCKPTNIAGPGVLHITERQKCDMCERASYRHRDSDMTREEAEHNFCNTLTGQEKLACLQLTANGGRICTESCSKRFPPGYCLQGPDVWCKSVGHATDCGTLSFCQHITWRAATPRL